MIAMPWGIGDTTGILMIKLYDRSRLNGDLILTCVGRSGDPGILNAFFNGLVISTDLKSLVSDHRQKPLKWAAAAYTQFTRHLPVVNNQPNDSI